MDVEESAQRALSILANEKLVAFDIETDGLDWKTNSPIGYVVSSPTESVYVPVRHTGGGNLNNPLNSRIHAFEIDLAEVASKMRGGQMLAGHNLKFDLHFAANKGIRFLSRTGNYDGLDLVCTQNTESLLNEYAKSFSLEATALRYGVTPKKGQDMYNYLGDRFQIPADSKSMAYFHELPGNDPMAVEYATGDGTATIELYKAQKELIHQQHLEDVWDIENRLLPVLMKMERKGIRIDETAVAKLQSQLKTEVDNNMLRLPKGFNIRSPKDVKEYVYNFRDDWPLTEKGNPSFTESWLSTFKEGQVIVDIRRDTNLMNSFLTPLVERHIFQGRVHTNFVQNKRDNGGTISGRLASNSPNIQQVPKHNKELARRFRKLFTADEGHLLCEMDYSQCEPRLFAHYSQDTNLREGYSSKPPKDVHQIVAELFDLPRDTTAKRMNMGMFTGMYPKTFSQHMGMSIHAATELRQKWLELFPGIAMFQRKAKQRIINRGYVRTLLGRRGRLEHPKFAYKAVSKIIQGSNADILKYKMVEVDALLEGTGADLLATVHDSFVLQIPKTQEGRELVQEIARVCEDVQSDPFNLSVPFKVDFKIGRTWKDASM